MSDFTHAAEVLVGDLAKMVSEIKASAAEPAPQGVTTTMASMVLSHAHVTTMRASGRDAATFCAVLQRQVADLIEGLKQFARTMPAGDTNIQAVNDLIARLG